MTALLLPLAAAFALYRLQGTAGLLDWVPKYRPHFFGICLAGLPAAVLFLASRGAGRFQGHGTAVLSRLLAATALGVSIVTIALTLTASALFLAGMRSVDPVRATAFRRPGIMTGQRVVLPVNRDNASPAGEETLLRLAFSSDMHAENPESAPEATRKIVDSVSRLGFDAFFILGDFAETGFPGPGFEYAIDCLSGARKDLPIIPLMGNHDAIIGGSWRYHRYFNPARYFHLEAGGVHLVALELLWGKESLDRAQTAWLRETLSAIPEDETIIVLSHCFMRASGYVDSESGRNWFDHEETTESVMPLLEEAGVDLVISGHNHYLEYLEGPRTGSSRGTAYAVVGAMGGKLDPVPSHRSPASVWIAPGRYGFLDLAIRNDSLELTFRDEHGNELSSFTRSTATD